MNFQIKLVKEVPVKEASGNWGSVPTPTEYDLWADIVEPSSSFRNYDAQTQLGQIKTFRIRLRSELDVNGNWKIIFHGKTWTVRSIEQEKERLFYWRITASHK